LRIAVLFVIAGAAGNVTDARGGREFFKGKSYPHPDGGVKSDERYRACGVRG
jgi:hypothetical protein